jgi:hypothetical protein
MTATLLETRPTSPPTSPPASRPRSAVRVVPVPRSEPPTDDELDTTGAAAPSISALLLPLDLATGARVRRRSRDSRGRRLPDRGARAIGGRGDSANSPGAVAPRWGDGVPHPMNPSDRPGVQGSPGSPTAATPGSPPDGEGIEPGEADLRPATRRIIGACVEVVGGYRPLSQLRPFCLPEHYDAIVNRLLRPAGRAMARGQAATRSSIVPGYGAPPAGRGPTDRVLVRRVQVCELRDGVAEIAVVMARRDKVWAMALRLERVEGRWLCSHLEVV